ncbi:MAG: hypothetical protein LBQ74_18470, partial [Prevotella sp.]|nr:hypothetical protein [Prevotella sp.]
MATKQSVTDRHCEERSDEAIQKSTTFRIASSHAMTKRREATPAMSMATTTIVAKNFLPFEDFLPFQDFALPKPHFYLIQNNRTTLVAMIKH